MIQAGNRNEDFCSLCWPCKGQTKLPYRFWRLSAGAGWTNKQGTIRLFRSSRSRSTKRRRMCWHWEGKWRIRSKSSRNADRPSKRFDNFTWRYFLVYIVAYCHFLSRDRRQQGIVANCGFLARQQSTCFWSKFFVPLCEREGVMGSLEVQSMNPEFFRLFRGLELLMSTYNV